MSNPTGTVHKNTAQKERILKFLQINNGKRVSCRDIVQQCRTLQYNARIWQLRKQGYEIENKIEMVKNIFGETVRHGLFRLNRYPDGEGI